MKKKRFWGLILPAFALLLVNGCGFGEESMLADEATFLDGGIILAEGAEVQGDDSALANEAAEPDGEGILPEKSPNAEGGLLGGAPDTASGSANDAPAMASGSANDEPATASGSANDGPATAPDAPDGGLDHRFDLTVADAYGQILDCCSREFAGGYPIDENFLAWVTDEFGESVVFSLSEAASSGELDPELWYALTQNSIHVLWDTYCKENNFLGDAPGNVYWMECADEEETVLDFVGDVNFAEGWSTMNYLEQQANGIYDCLGASLLDELNGADILMVNNEFAYSRRGEPLAGKDYTFRADPDSVSLLDAMGTDIVSLANNHTYDYGPDALLDTLATLREAQIPYVGAGEDLEEAERPAYFIANGRKIAIVAATQIERTSNYTKEATETEPGVLKTLTPQKFVSVIEGAAAQSDYVIAFVHWGTEYQQWFGSDQKKLADAFVAAGADAIIGGHTHCLQGCEYRDGVPIIYSLGNFWFNSKTIDTGIAQLVLHRDGTVDFRFLPCVQKANQTYLVEDAQEKQRILDYLGSISMGVEFDGDGYVTAEE